MTTVSPKKGHDPSRVNEISAKLMENPEIAALIGELSTSVDDASDLVKGLLQASINAGLQAEMDAHLGYGHSDRAAKAQVSPSNGDNHRNGSYTKTVGTGYGPVDITVPRDRAGTFHPVMVPKGARRLTELDDMIVSLYAGGMTVRDIQHHLASTLGVDISPDTISTITDAVLDEVMVWQNRQLDEFYPVIFLDALRVKIRDGHRVVNKACYMAVGIDIDGTKHILGLWIADNEGAAFWASVCADLANRGVNDVFIVCCDGLKGLPEAVEATWPNSMVQTCIVHLIRAANRWVSYKDRKSVSSALRQVYTAPNEDAACAALDAFEASELGRKYPQSVKVWRDAWERFIPFLQFPPAARRVLYTTNAIESLNAELRKATRNRGQFPTDAAALKTLWLMVCNIEDKRAAQRAKKAKRAIDCNGYIEGAKTSGWKQAINQLSVAYPDRFANYL
ncbi:IS256 family transposase [Corynebacterium auris]|uniref:IS256 family transposase n=1 Tax=Corynebacterium auris TaxID=44750 RepID=UPI0025B3FA80|nr:IS256 family transposase [Corynebacterium auris]WJY67004.1 Transposase, Mutator family [Corynebacterium auris]WJY69074.1 Transposase, Mutator family [Corynebacterium auris]